jgi:cell division protein ZapA (FtsZ GTPase activity inhibitor)
MDSVKNKIDVQILDRLYPIEVEQESLVAFEETVNELNQRLNLFRSKYSNKDKQDSLAIVALQLAAEVSELKIKLQNAEQADSILDRLNGALDNLV